MLVTKTQKTDKAGDSVAEGVVWIMVGNLSILVAGYIVHAYLGRVLGPALYGGFGVIMALLVWFEVSLTGAFPYAIRKLGSENQEMMPKIAGTALGGQLAYAAVIFALTQLFAPWAAAALGDPSLTLLIRIASLDIPVYAIYYCYLGVLNGRALFQRQGVAIVVYSLSKLAVIVALVAAGMGVKGALIGNAGASLFGLAAARLLAGPIPLKMEYPLRKMIGFVIATAILSIVYTFLINMDVFLVKALMKDKDQVGAYVAAWTLAKAPFMMFLAISNVTLPAVARALSEEDYGLARTYVSQSFRFHLMLLMPLTAVVAAASSRIVVLIYGSNYLAGSTSLAILVVAFMLWGLLNGSYNLLLAKHCTVYPVVAVLGLIAVMAGTGYLLVRGWGIVGGAASAAILGGLGLVPACIKVHSEFGALVPLKSFLKILTASLVSYAAVRLVDLDGLAVLGTLAGSFALYVVVLLLMREITAMDIRKLAAVGRS